MGTSLARYRRSRALTRCAHRVDHRPDGVDERHPAAGLRQAGVAAPHLATGGAHAEAPSAEPAVDGVEHAVHLAAEQHRHHELAAGEADGSQERVDLLAQTAAGHEHQALAPLGELVGQLQGDAAAEGVAHEGGPLDAERHHQVPQAAGVGAEGVVAPGLGRVAVAQEVGRQHGEVVGQGRHHLLPGGGAPGQAVDQDHRRAGSGHAVADLVAMDRDVAEAQVVGVVGHGVHCGRAPAPRRNPAAQATTGAGSAGARRRSRNRTAATTITRATSPSSQ